MGRTATNSTIKNVVEENDVVDTVEEMNEEKTKIAKKSVKEEPLEDSDEIEVVSLVPNVSYKDSKTLDMYEWHEVGHSEPMTFEILKNMWRNDKGYFKNPRANIIFDGKRLNIFSLRSGKRKNACFYHCCSTLY